MALHFARLSQASRLRAAAKPLPGPGGRVGSGDATRPAFQSIGSRQGYSVLIAFSNQFQRHSPTILPDRSPAMGSSLQPCIQGTAFFHPVNGIPEVGYRISSRIPGSFGIVVLRVSPPKRPRHS